MASWEKTTLGEIFEIGSSKRVLRSQWKKSGVPFYRAREIVKLAKHGYVDNDLFIDEDHFVGLAKVGDVPRKGDLMISAVGTLGACYEVKDGDKFYYKDASVLLLRPRVELAPRFMQYAFLSDRLLDSVNSGQGATVGTFTITRARETQFWLPSLDEQQRIVAKLDLAFAALDRARVNAEANLADARALFDQLLQDAFATEVTEAGVLSFDLLCEPLTPKAKIKRKDYLEQGEYPIVSQEANLISGYWNDPAALMGLGEPVVVFGDHTRCLKYIDFDFVVGADGAKVLKPKCGISAAYLYFGLRSQPIAEGGYARHFKLLRRKYLPNIPLERQDAIAEKLFDMEARFKEVASHYEDKLTEVATLRQSLLQQAFSGQLT